MDARGDSAATLADIAFTLPGAAPSWDYCAALLHSLGAATHAGAQRRARDTALQVAADWAQSGLIPLTGPPDGPPLQGPGSIPSCARGALDALRLLAGAALLPGCDGATVLGERAALLNLERRGTISANGSCRLLRTRDGWLALNLAREDDWQLLPAWLATTARRQPHTAPGDWAAIEQRIANELRQPLVERGRLLGLPLAAAGTAPAASTWFRLHCAGPRAPKRSMPRAQPLVIDLSALWAGPLCSHLLLAAGARVIKVECRSRLDGARRGSTGFFDLLNAGKESVLLDFATTSGRSQLATLLARADIVIEGSRPRALRQLGVDAEALVAARPGLVWVAISGYGRREPGADWTAFGDDAAVAAGVAAATSDPPAFCGDALADPLTGLHAAVAALAFWRAGRGGLLDLSLRDTTAYCLQFQRDVPRGTVTGEPGAWQLTSGGRRFAVRSPVARRSRGPAPPPGTHTARIMREFQLPC
ncbi:MAG: CoA transferase [Halioglobus sp.]|nr:CoA transferase [Halioglobus sp.]